MKTQLKILLVDDEVDVLHTISLLLSDVHADSPYQIFQANNAKEAINFIKSRPDDLDLIISDINMDETNGIQLAEMVRELNPNIRIVLMSGFMSLIDQIKFFKLGIEKILIKPFNIEELVSVIDNPAERKEMPIANMIPVQVNMLIDTNKTPLDLYVHISGEKFIKMFPANQIVNQERLGQFLNQDVHFLYAKKEDYFNLSLMLYVPTRVSSFKTSRSLDFNVFYLDGEEYKQLIPAGSIITQDMLEVIKNHQIKILYIIDRDHNRFLNYLDQTIDQYLQKKDISVEDKGFAVSTLLKERTKLAYANFNRENVANLRKSQKHLMNYLKDNPIKDLLKLNEQDKGIHIHASMVASLSYAILLEIIAMRADKEERLKIRALDEYIFESDDVKEIIFTGALLHDIGKPLIQLNQGELDANLKDHPQIAHDKLNALDLLHPKSLEIILQHEEFCDGSGYPKKLKKTGISFFSQVVILANYFDKIKRGSDLTNEQCLMEINKVSEKFNKHLIPILERVLAANKK